MRRRSRSPGAMAKAARKGLHGQNQNYEEDCDDHCNMNAGATMQTSHRSLGMEGTMTVSKA